MSGERDLERLLARADPVRRPGEYVYVAAAAADLAGVSIKATVIEDEGPSHVVERSDADALDLDYDLVLAWITLRIHSALDAVGLTSAFSAALADEGISANVLAGLRHDHILVPVDRAEDALRVLGSLSRR